MELKLDKALHVMLNGLTGSIIFRSIMSVFFFRFFFLWHTTLLRQPEKLPIYVAKYISFGGKRHTRISNPFLSTVTQYSTRVTEKHCQSGSIPLTLYTFSDYYNTGSNWLFLFHCAIVS